MVSTDVSDHFISWDLCSTFIWFKCSFYLHCEGPWSQAYDTHMTPNCSNKKHQVAIPVAAGTQLSSGSVQEHLGHSPASLLLPTWAAGFVC